MKTVVRTVRLNLCEPTFKKRWLLNSMIRRYVGACNTYLAKLQSQKVRSKFSLQSLCYDSIRELYDLHSQLVVDSCKEVWMQKSKVKKMEPFKYQPVRFNVSRSGRFKETDRHNPVVVMADVCIPIKQDGGYVRFKDLLSQGYSFTQFSLNRSRGVFSLSVMLKKDFKIEVKSNVVGVDVGVNCLAAISVVSENRPIRQLYFGQDLYQVKRDLGVRRSILQGRDTSRTRRALRKIGGYETNYSNTRCYQIAHQVVRLALEHDASIAIEDLKDLNESKLSRKSNRKVKRMPYAKFRTALESVAWQNGLDVVSVDPAYTSQTCSRCGERGSRDGLRFSCKCGMLVNSDRNASVNIAHRAAQVLRDKATSCQTPMGGTLVNESVRCCEESLQHISYLGASPHPSGVGR